MRPNRLFFLAAVILCVFVASGPARAQTDASIAEFIAYFDKSIQAIRADAPDGDARTREKCKPLLDRVLDIDLIARSAAGEQWNNMTPAQRSGFRSGVETRIVAECAKNVRQHHGETANLLGVRNSENGEKLATTRLALANGTDRTVVWRLRSGGPKAWRAVDVITNGRSAAADLRNEYAGFLQGNDNNIDALITMMQR